MIKKLKSFVFKTSFFCQQIWLLKKWALKWKDMILSIQLSQKKSENVFKWNKLLWKGKKNSARGEAIPNFFCIFWDSKFLYKKITVKSLWSRETYSRISINVLTLKILGIFYRQKYEWCHKSRVTSDWLLVLFFKLSPWGTLHD